MRKGSSSAVGFTEFKHEFGAQFQRAQGGFWEGAGIGLRGFAEGFKGSSSEMTETLKQLGEAMETAGKGLGKFLSMIMSVVQGLMGIGMLAVGGVQGLLSGGQNTEIAESGWKHFNQASKTMQEVFTDSTDEKYRYQYDNYTTTTADVHEENRKQSEQSGQFVVPPFPQPVRP